MPWKESNVMNLRTEFVLRALHNEVPFNALCQEYGISPKTGYKWKERFLSKGVWGLSDQSRKPHSSPKQISEDRACRLIRLKLAHRNWGPKKIRELFARQCSDSDILSLSTVKRIFDKAGLVERRRRRKASHCGRIENRIEAKSPNDIWTVDFKGWWYSVDNKRVEPLTVRDAHSRYILCADVMTDSKSQTVRRRFERLFETYGMPRTIRSDNGPPFACVHAPLGLSRLSAWWIALGIDLDRIAPGHPEQNGGHERMHRDISCEIENNIDGDINTNQAALEVWRHQFNHQRPHEAIGMRVPAELYVKSQRRFEPEGFDLSYPSDYLRRKVTVSGCIKIMNRLIHISKALDGWEVGLKAVGLKYYSVWFGPLCLGEIDVETESFNVVQL
jgi:transposase InsO family protein